MTTQYKNFSELDFDQIKNSFREYLKTQPFFKGYNFEGAAISALMNLLAYNTQYNAFYLNMHASERFISTAQRRENVVARAKDLGYMPQGAAGAKASLKLRIPTDTNFTDLVMTIPRHTTFKASTDTDNFTFYTSDTYTLYRESASVAFETPDTDPGVLVFEGKKFIQNFTLGTDDTGVTIPNKNVQLDTIEVQVGSGSAIETYFPASNFTDADIMNSTANVYFLEEVVGQKIRIYFGDDVIGKKPITGSRIQVTYFTTKGTQGNSASKFTIADQIQGASSVTVKNRLDLAAFGTDVESIESIRINAPRAFSTQGRAVTANDFKSILMTKLLDETYAVAVWGGEEEVWVASDLEMLGAEYQPYVGLPKLGYVFISIMKKGASDFFLPIAQKQYIQTELRTKFDTVTIFPQVVDPEILYLQIATKVKYDGSKEVDIRGLSDAIKAAIIGDFETNYNSFQTTLRYSKLSTAIDASSPVIISNSLSVSFYREYAAKEMIANGIKLNMSVSQGSTYSTTFTYTIPSGIPKSGTYSTAYFTDKNSAGIGIDLRYRNSQNVEQVLIANAATIDRKTGDIVFAPEFNLQYMSGVNAATPLKMYAVGSEKDLSFTRNRIPVLRYGTSQGISTDIIVEVVEE